MFKVYAFSNIKKWAVDASTLEEAERIAGAFEARGLIVRIYSHYEDQEGKILESLVKRSKAPEL